MIGLGFWLVSYSMTMQGLQGDILANYSDPYRIFTLNCQLVCL